MATLYAALGGSSTTSDLYTVDPATAAMTPIGPIGFGLTGLCLDPTSGIMYGVTNNNSASNPRSLITVDLTTGAGTLVGSFGVATSIGDISIDTSGTIYGEGQDSFLYTINKSTGAATAVGHTGSFNVGQGIAFDSTGVLYGSGNGDNRQLVTIDPSTGISTIVVNTMTGATPNGGGLSAFAFDPSDILYASDSKGFGSPAFWNLYTLDVATGTLTLVGALNTNTDALAWVGTAAPNFSFTLTPSSLSIPAGSSDTSALATTAVGGDTESITLSATGQPAGVTVGFSANPIVANGAGSTITVNTSSSTVPGTYSITIHAVGTSNTHTHTLTLIVIATTGTNFTCETAVELRNIACPGGTLTVNNSGAPNTSPLTDPFNVVYDLGWSFQRQLWYKFTNPTSSKAYIQFTFHNPTAAAYFFFAALFLGSCGALTEPDPLEDFHLVFGGNLTIRGDQDPAYVWDVANPGVDYASNTFHIKIGVLLDPGQTVWMEIGGDDGEGSPTGLNGEFRFTWSLREVLGYYDTTDKRTPVSEGGLGLSETVPPNTGIDIYAPFTGTPAPGEVHHPSFFQDYVRHDGYHWLLVSDHVAETNANPTQTQTQLAVWQIDDTGAIISTTIVDTFIDFFSHGPTFYDKGSGFLGDAVTGAGLTPRFASDETNLWIICRVKEAYTNPWDTSIPPHTWNAGRVTAYYWSGVWTRIASLDGKSCNVTDSNGGGIDGGALTFDCFADAADPWHVHVVMAERGATRSRDGLDNSIITSQAFGENPSGWVTRTAYAIFSTSGLVSTFDIAYDHQAAVPSTRAGAQRAMGDYFWTRWGDGVPLFGWIVPRTDGTLGYQLQSDFYSVSGGAASLLLSIGSSFIAPTLPASKSGATIQRLLDGWLSSNHVVDIGFDGRDCYFVHFTVQTSAGNYTLMARLPIADIPNPRYFDDDPLLTQPQGIAYTGSPIFCNVNQTWRLAGGSSQVAYAWKRCRAAFSGFLWTGENLSTGPFSPAEAYPALRNDTPGMWLDGSSLYYGATYQINSDPAGFGTPHAAFATTKLLEDYFICDLGPEVECPTSSGLHIWSRISLR